MYFITCFNNQFTLGPSKLYGCEVSRCDHLERRDGGKFDAQEYDEHPERYISTFSKKIAPYASGMFFFKPMDESMKN